MLRALLLDLDGTLADSNDLHTDALAEAFAALGYDVERDAVAAQIGKGGDKLVADLLGDDAEARHGDELRERAADAFERRVRERGVALFPGALALIEAAKARGLGVAIATSSSEDDLGTLFDAAGTDLREHVDAVTTKSDVDASKPEADVVHAALEKLGVEPGEAVLVGDTRYDFEAAGRAGVAGIGMATWVYDADALRRAGAAVVYADVADLHAHLDAALDAVTARAPSS